MKKIFSFFISLFFILQANAQAHLGSTETAIRNMYPEKVFKSAYTKSGVKYISVDMIYGNFTYYFNKDTKLSDYCIQIPFSIPSMNGQVEAYNKKYVITSDTSWTAYVENGGIMYIKLLYDKESKMSYFTYSDEK